MFLLVVLSRTIMMESFFKVFIFYWDNFNQENKGYEDKEINQEINKNNEIGARMILRKWWSSLGSSTKWNTKM